jgi:hypothetical protein
MTEIGRTVLKLFDSTFRLEIAISALRKRGFGAITPLINLF